METSLQCVRHIVTTVDGYGHSMSPSDSSLVGLRIVGAFETFATEVSADFTSIGTTMYANV